MLLRLGALWADINATEKEAIRKAIDLVLLQQEAARAWVENAGVGRRGPRAGRRLHGRGGHPPGREFSQSKKVALNNDILVASSCRNVGATLVTQNLEDFEVIRGLIRFRFTGL